MTKIIGIDLGTTNSLVATVDSGIPLVIADQEGRRLTVNLAIATRGFKKALAISERLVKDRPLVLFFRGQISNGCDEASIDQ